MSNKEQFEREFESFLNEEDSRVAALYRKLPRPEPDAKLDAPVLAMARRAVTTAPRMHARTPRWIPALSAAAENAAAPAPAAANIDERTQPADTGALKDKAASKPSLVPMPEPQSRAVP